MRSVEATEHQEQAALFQWAGSVTARYPELDLMFAIPNGGARSEITGALLSREGVKAGVPDLFLPAARGPWHGLFIEMKSRSGTTRPAQVKWIENLRLQGYHCTVCHGWEQARDQIEWYLSQGNS